MSIYFIGDTHFFSNNILNMERSHFKSITEMNDYIVQQINSVVKNDDSLYIVGDFADTEDENDVLSILSKINGEIYFIEGNHDKPLSEFYKQKFGWKYSSTPVVLDDFWIISHQPMFVTVSAPYANIFAHVHGNPMYKTVSSRSFCVSGDRHDFKPVSFEVIKQSILMASQECFVKDSNILN